eukprot:9151217-Alexandrium_andersonii.AAC.1
MASSLFRGSSRRCSQRSLPRRDSERAAYDGRTGILVFAAGLGTESLCAGSRRAGSWSSAAPALR